MKIQDNFCYFCIKIYVVTPHLNRLDETVQMRGHNICLRLEIRKINFELCSVPHLSGALESLIVLNISE